MVAMSCKEGPIDPLRSQLEYEVVANTEQPHRCEVQQEIKPVTDVFDSQIHIQMV